MKANKVYGVYDGGFHYGHYKKKEDAIKAKKDALKHGYKTYIKYRVNACGYVVY